MSKIIAKITADLAPLVNNIECREAFQIVEEKEKVFDKFRQAMSSGLPDTTDALNDNGEDVEINTIENSVNEFKQWILLKECNYKNNDFQKIITQIEKYG